MAQRKHYCDVVKTILRRSSLKKLLGLELYQKDLAPETPTKVKNLRNIYEHLFCRTPPCNCFLLVKYLSAKSQWV